jgi:pSer/pThr/pTyr-binding forkhead associated (FHA) protein
VPRGTVVRDEQRSPGTILHSQKYEVPVAGWLVILRGRRKGRDFRIEKENSVLGRDGMCDYVIEDDTVSREHARIRKEGDRFILFDLGSGNGTYLNGERIQRSELQDGDVIKVGESLILFKDAKPRVSLQQADAPTPPSA